MRIALEEAEKAASLGDVPVGALVVNPHGEILARAGNGTEQLADPTAHAEILALRKAARALGNARLCDCVLVASLEPCLMCLGACAHARIAGLVYGACDARAGAVCSACELMELPLLGRAFWHLGGILAQESASLLQGFFARRRPGLVACQVFTVVKT